jgi:hypothetical protein
LTVLQCGDFGCASAVFAMCCSRLGYWLWRVEGDGFHLSTQFLLDLPLPFGKQNNRAVPASLLNLSRHLWEQMLESPIVSTNKGVRTVSFSPVSFDGTLSAIDELLSKHFALPSDFPSFLRDFCRETIVAGRDAELPTNSALQRLSYGIPNDD